MCAHMVRQRVPCTVRSVHGTVRFLRSCADIGGQFFLMGRRDCTLQDKARTERRVAVKRCNSRCQPVKSQITATIPPSTIAQKMESHGEVSDSQINDGDDYSSDGSQRSIELEGDRNSQCHGSKFGTDFRAIRDQQAEQQRAAMAERNEKIRKRKLQRRGYDEDEHDEEVDGGFDSESSLDFKRRKTPYRRLQMQRVPFTPPCRNNSQLLPPSDHDDEDSPQDDSEGGEDVKVRRTRMEWNVVQTF